VKTAQTVDVVKADPSDNRILECAAAAKSDYIITGDDHLLRLGGFEGIPIIKVADFLKLAQAS
jgi:predicted nucleic acid-binding protein